MSVPLSLGFSPCPNDTFIFNALVHGLVPAPCKFKERLEDVETLNRLVLAGELDVSKVSYHLFGHVRDQYCLLRSGGALGRGCGPLLVAAQPLSINELRDRPIAVPGEFTTACLLLRLYAPGLSRLLFMPFSEIMPSVARGEVAAGVIIHESRFTYQGLGLVKLLDLGEWWEGETGEPIPLGGIVARRSLGSNLIAALDRSLAASAAHAQANPEAAAAYVRAHAQEMSEEVCAAHIGLYVNRFTLGLGDDGIRAVEVLLGRAGVAGILPPSSKNIFWD
jgi:1,4-dihydroxy-6-naphthoate synthase